MRRLFPMCLLAAAACAQKDPPPPPGADEQKKIIAAVTARALDYVKTLPDFVCTQVTRRNIDPTGTGQHWRLVETSNEELTFSDHKENYKVVAVNGKPASNASHHKSAEFRNLLGYIFDPKAQAELNWTNWDSLRAHRVHAIGFKVTQAHSLLTIAKSKGQPITAGLFGVVYADSETAEVLRIALAATDIPAKFPIQSVSFDVNYEFGKIGDQVYLLPLKVDQHSKDGKSMIWNEVEFRDFRKAGAK